MSVRRRKNIKASDDKGMAVSGKENERQKTNNDGRDLRSLLMRV